MALEAFIAADTYATQAHASAAQRERSRMETCFSQLSEAARKQMQEGKLHDPCGVPVGSLSYTGRFRIEHAQVLLPADFDPSQNSTSSPPCSPRTSSPT